MRWIGIVLVAFVLAVGSGAGVGCAKKPDADATVGSRPALAMARGVGSEFADGAAGMGDAPALSGLRAPAAAQAPVATAESTPTGVPREVIYRAELRLIVVSIADATHAVQALAEQAGGHLQQSGSTSITVRVPASSFDATIERIADLGEPIDRSITASDVSEEMLDLNIRLENARKTRDRLLAHLDRSQKIADTLKIEAELARVSETIEQIEGKLRFMRSHVALSTITVFFTARSPERSPAAVPLGLPFGWIEELGDGLLAGQVANVPREPGLFDFAPKFEPPADFIRYFTNRIRVEALSADGLRIKVRRHDNHDRGALAFWRDLARESLVRSRGVAVAEERSLGDDRTLIRGTREVGGRALGYVLVLKRTGRRVQSFEAWGPQAAFDARFPELEASAKTLR